MTRHRIVVVTSDALIARMAGPAIRAFQIAVELAKEHDVRLLTTSTCEISHPGLTVASVSPAELRRAEQWCDVFVFQGYFHRFLRDSEKVLVVDIYDPFHLEELEQTRALSPRMRGDVVAGAVAMLNEQLVRGDFFMCATEKQRDFWLGQLAGLGRINPVTYEGDENLRSLITVAPFGIEAEPPVRTGAAIRGVIPPIGEHDDVLLWGGGIYNWFDPLTLIRAVHRLQERRPTVRLVFMGMRYPNPAVPEMPMATEARRLARSLGLDGTHVFFNEDWVPYDERQNFLLDADVAVSTHLDHVETAFAFRTRVLDYIWAALPIVATRGDAMADFIEARSLGLTVPAGDEAALADALFRMLDDETLAAATRANAARVRAELTWSTVLEPLVAFCRSPRRAPDLIDAQTATRLRRTARRARRDRLRSRVRRFVAEDMRRAAGHLRRGRVDHLLGRVVDRVRSAARGRR